MVGTVKKKESDGVLYILQSTGKKHWFRYISPLSTLSTNVTQQQPRIDGPGVISP